MSSRRRPTRGSLAAALRSRGVDVILDYIGGDYAEKNIKLLAEDGRMVIIGFLKGPRVAMQRGFSLGKHLAEPHLAEATHDHRLHAPLTHSGVQA